jgi:hypothetical protein
MKKSSKSQKFMEYMMNHPSAKVGTVAKKFGITPSLGYQLRKKALENQIGVFAPPEDDGTPGPSLAHEALVRADSAMRKAKQTPEQKAKRIAHYFPDHVPDVNATLDTRAKDYGLFKDGAALMQSLKRNLAEHATKHGKTFADDQWEALEMIVHKMGRIVNGNPDVVDHWVDIAGYATLVADRLQGKAR